MMKRWTTVTKGSVKNIEAKDDTPPRKNVTPTTCKTAINGMNIVTPSSSPKYPPKKKQKRCPELLRREKNATPLIKEEQEESTPSMTESPSTGDNSTNAASSSASSCASLIVSPSSQQLQDQNSSQKYLLDTPTTSENSWTTTATTGSALPNLSTASSQEKQGVRVAASKIKAEEHPSSNGNDKHNGSNNNDFLLEIIQANPTCCYAYVIPPIPTTPQEIVIANYKIFALVHPNTSPRQLARLWKHKKELLKYEFCQISIVDDFLGDNTAARIIKFDIVDTIIKQLKPPPQLRHVYTCSQNLSGVPNLVAKTFKLMSNAIEDYYNYSYNINATENENMEGKTVSATTDASHDDDSIAPKIMNGNNKANLSWNKLIFPEYLLDASNNNRMLSSAFRYIQQLLPAEDCECWNSVQLCKEYYEYWKPPHGVKVLLLAESHVYTPLKDSGIRGPIMDRSKLKTLEDNATNIALYKGPVAYVAVHLCLGYGEEQILISRQQQQQHEGGHCPPREDHIVKNEADEANEGFRPAPNTTRVKVEDMKQDQGQPSQSLPYATNVKIEDIEVEVQEPCRSISSITPTDIPKGAKTGTPQFWKMLESISSYAGSDDDEDENINHDIDHVVPLSSQKPASKSKSPKKSSLLKSSGNSFEQRISRKLKILEDLKSRGIWLVDANPLGWYIPQQPGYYITWKTKKPHTNRRVRPSSDLYKPVFVLAWELYTKHLIRQLTTTEGNKPQLVVPIGKEFTKAIGRSRIINAVNSTSCRVMDAISQPNAWGSRTYSMLRKEINQVAPPNRDVRCKPEDYEQVPIGVSKGQKEMNSI